MRILRNTNIDFLKYNWLYFAISMGLFVLTVVSLVVHKGPYFGIDFSGGTFLQVGFTELPKVEEIRSTLSEGGWKNFSMQTQPAHNSLMIRIKEGDKSTQDIAKELIISLKNKYGDKVKDIPERVEFVGPAVGKQLIANACWAIFWSMIVILVYVAWRFDNFVWGFTSVVALAHDVVLTVGVLTVLKIEISLVVVAALLTLVGYSINDTIVIFDRVRENLRGNRKEPIRDLLNRSLNETLARTVNTSMTTFLASLALYFLGGEVIHDFAFTYCFGVVIGTYSSVAVAVPLAYLMKYAEK